MRGVKLCMAITAGTTPARRNCADAAGDGAVVGQKVADDAVDHRSRASAPGCRDDAAVADLGDRGRRARAAVGVDDQPRQWFSSAGASSSRASRRVRSAAPMSQPICRARASSLDAELIELVPALRGRHGRTGSAPARAPAGLKRSRSSGSGMFRSAWARTTPRRHCLRSPHGRGTRRCLPLVRSVSRPL